MILLPQTGAIHINKLVALLEPPVSATKVWVSHYNIWLLFEDFEGIGVYHITSDL